MESAPTLESAAKSLVEAVDILVTQTATGRLLGVGQAAISKRIAKGQPAAAEWVPKLSDATGIPRHRFRPDLYLVEGPVLNRVEGPIHAPDPPPPAPGRPRLRRDGLQLGEPVR